jgi:biotin carboxylase
VGWCGATALSGGSGSSGVAIAQTATELAALLTRNQANSEIISEVNALYAELVATGAS